MPKISVIVPVYNGEKYLRECLDSLVRQTMADIEILAVDNGSEDGSAEILREYAEKDNRIVVITQRPNIGPAGGRNLALDRAAGEYIAFCDCDDTVPEMAYAMLYETAIRERADVVVGDYEENDNGQIIQHEICKSAKSAYVICTMGALWNKLYRRKFLEERGVRIPDCIGDEDLLFLAFVVKEFPRYALLNCSIYTYYRYTENTCANSKIATKQMVENDSKVRLQYDEIISKLGFEQADARAFYSFRYLFKKWSAIGEDAEKRAAFPFLQSFVEQSAWDHTGKWFQEAMGVRPDEFAGMTYDEFKLHFQGHCVEKLFENEELLRKNAASKEAPAIATMELFAQGALGFRYIWFYFNRWFSFKVKRLRGKVK